MRDLREAVLRRHALERMAARRVSEAEVRAVLERPDAVLAVRPGRVVAQGLLGNPGGGRLLLRVFVDVDRDPPQVVTVYRTSKVEKYGRAP